MSPVPPPESRGPDTRGADAVPDLPTELDRARLADRLNAKVHLLLPGLTALSVGVDVEDIARWRDPKRRLDDLFTADELAYAATKADPAPTYAGLWCAREAAWKALAAYSPLGQRQLAVAHDAAGAPRIVALHPRDADLVARLRLSITHSRETAAAVALLTAGPSGS